jgi:hypothetical protein
LFGVRILECPNAVGTIGNSGNRVLSYGAWPNPAGDG